MAKNHPRPIPELTQKDIDRFWRYVDKTPGYGPKGDCWPRFLNLTPDKYGIFPLPRIAGKRQRFGSHRVAYYLGTGDNPGALNVLHSCDFPPCCNPAHLSKDTQAANMADMVKKGRQATGDRCGARLYPEKRPRGVNHWAFKFTNEQKQEIRSKYVKGNGPRLAKEYGCTNATIHRIIHS